MTDEEIGYIDYTTMNVDKNATYDSLRDRVVLITGAGQAIGRGYAHYFSAQGAIPIIADINGENAQKVLREIEEKQGKAMAVEVDFAYEQSNIDMVEKILADAEKDKRTTAALGDVLWAVLNSAEFALNH